MCVGNWRIWLCETVVCGKERGIWLTVRAAVSLTFFVQWPNHTCKMDRWGEIGRIKKPHQKANKKAVSKSFIKQYQNAASNSSVKIPSQKGLIAIENQLPVLWRAYTLYNTTNNENRIFLTLKLSTIETPTRRCTEFFFLKTFMQPFNYLPIHLFFYLDFNFYETCQLIQFELIIFLVREIRDHHFSTCFTRLRDHDIVFFFVG